MEDDDDDVGPIPFKRGFKIPSRFNLLSWIPLLSFHSFRAEQLRGILDDGEKEDSISKELYPFEEFFENIPQPTYEDDWLAQYKEDRQSFRVSSLIFSFSYS